MSTHPLEALRQRVQDRLLGNPIEPPMNDEDLEAMRQRTAERTRAAIEALGSKWTGYNRNTETARA